jgi:hypothetical protein
MPTPQAYDRLYREHEELKWFTRQLLDSLPSMSGEPCSIPGKIYNEVDSRTCDCEGPPAWLAEDPYAHAVVIRDADGSIDIA